MMTTLVSGPYFPSSHAFVGQALLLRAIAQLMSGDRYSDQVSCLRKRTSLPSLQRTHRRVWCGVVGWQGWR